MYWGAVKREWAHPIRSNFVFTPFLTSLTLVAAVPRPISQGELCDGGGWCIVLGLRSLSDFKRTTLYSMSIKAAKGNKFQSRNKHEHFWNVMLFEAMKIVRVFGCSRSVPENVSVWYIHRGMRVSAVRTLSKQRSGIMKNS